MNNKTIYEIFENSENMGARNHYLPLFRRIMNPPSYDIPTWDGYDLSLYFFQDNLSGRDSFRDFVRYYANDEFILKNYELIRNGLQTGSVEKQPEHLMHPLGQIEAIKYMSVDIRILFFDLACKYDWVFAWKVFPQYFPKVSIEKVCGAIVTPDLNPNNIIEKVNADIEALKKKQLK